MKSNQGVSLLEVLIAGVIAMIVIFSIRITLTKELLQLKRLYQQVVNDNASGHS